MKITCQSCQSKYNVADDKVQGRVVKIRCRKCGATIIVNGTGGAGAAEAGSNGAGAAHSSEAPTRASEMPGFDGAADGSMAQWHVNVSDTDQRTMSTRELCDAYAGGVVTQDTFVWCDGMDDWKPLGEVEVIASAVHGGTASAQAPPDAHEAPQAAPEAPAFPSPGPFAFEPPTAPAALSAPVERRAAVVKREARGARDLFSAAGGEDVQASAPDAHQALPPAFPDPTDGAGPPGLTGQRNENSVLFSLAVLTKNAEQRAQSNQTTATKEDSGLIDLKALAAKAESARPAAMGAGDDGGGVFVPALGMTPAPLGSPVLGAPLGQAEDRSKSKLPLFAGMGAGVLLLLVVGIGIGAKIAGSDASHVPSAATLVAPPATTAEPAASAATATATAQASASAAPSASASVAAAPKPPPRGGGGWRPPAAGGAARPTPPSGGGGGAATPAPAPRKGGGDCGCNGDLMCLMKCSAK